MGTYHLWRLQKDDDQLSMKATFTRMGIDEVGIDEVGS